MNEEIWKVIAGSGGLYQVSNLGRVMCLKGGTSKILSPSKSGAVRIMKDGIKISRGVHFLVAEAFVKKPYALCKHVRFVDGDKSNCRADNLVWSVKKKMANPQLRLNIYTPRKDKKRGEPCEIAIENMLGTIRASFKWTADLAYFLNVNAAECERFLRGESTKNRMWNIVEFVPW